MVTKLKEDKIVISSCAMVSPWGFDCIDFINQLDTRINGHNVHLDDFNVEKVDISKLESLMDGKGLRHMSYATKYGIYAAKSCLSSSCLDGAVNGFDTGVVVGSHLGHVDVLTKMMNTINEEGANGLSPLASGNGAINVMASTIGIKTASKALNTTIHNGFTSGLDSVIYSCNLLVNGRADYFITGAAESESTYYTDWLKAHGCNTCYDGAGMLIVEKNQTAMKRGIEPLGEIKGFSTVPCCGLPSIKQNLKLLIEASSLQPEEVDGVIYAGSFEGEDLEKIAFKELGIGGNIFNIRAFVGDGLSLTGIAQVIYGLELLKKGYKNVLVHLCSYSGNLSGLVLSRYGE